MSFKKNSMVEKGLITPQYRRLRTKFSLLIFSFAIVAFVLSLALVFIARRIGVNFFIFINPFAMFIALYFLSLLLASLLAIYVVQTILKPLEKLGNASKRVATGDFSVRLEDEYGSDELHATYKNFNYMVSELSTIETLRNDFVANVSHEFKTPISAIEGYATLLQDPDLTPEERNEYIQKIVFNTGRLADLSGNILLLSKLENQDSTLLKETYRLDEQIREAVLVLEPKWSAKNIELELEEMDEITFSGAKSLLLQVWTNIIGNAIKFSDDEGYLKITLKNEEAFVTAEFIDHGEGMDEETIRHIFEKFYQGDTSRKSAGNGLGLALCNKIVSLSGGTIDVSSKKGEGSVFTVRLPK